MENFIKYSFYFFIAALTVFPILELLKTKRILTKFILVSALLFFIIVTVWNKKIENAESQKAKENIDSLNTKLGQVSKSILLQKESYKQFLDTLKIKYHIDRDSNTNKPTAINNYTTNIEKAEKVHIGPGN